MIGTTHGQIMAAMAYVDDPDVIEKARADVAFQLALETSRPPNWWGTGASHTLLDAARVEGLPLYGIPRTSIISTLDLSADADERVKVLLLHQDDILDDCEAALYECVHAELVNDVTLTRASLDAFRGGHHAAAMALAVSLGEPLAAWAATPRSNAFISRQEMKEYNALRSRSKYGWANIEMDRAWIDATTGKVHNLEFNYQVLIAPLKRFFTPFFGRKDEELPVGLSRHVVAHQATVEHFTVLNSLLAVMLICSILVAQHEWAEEVDADDQSAMVDSYEGDEDSAMDAAPR